MHITVGVENIPLLVIGPNAPKYDSHCFYNSCRPQISLIHSNIPYPITNSLTIDAEIQYSNSISTLPYNNLSNPKPPIRRRRYCFLHPCNRKCQKMPEAKRKYIPTSHRQGSRYPPRRSCPSPDRAERRRGDGSAI
jgi:hypothetical protein